MKKNKVYSLDLAYGGAMSEIPLRYAQFTRMNGKRIVSIKTYEPTRTSLSRLTKTANKVIHFVGTYKVYLHMNGWVIYERENDIRIEFTDEALWGATDPNEYGRDASVRNCARAVKNAVKDEYPDAELLIVCGDWDGVTVDGRLDHEEIGNIRNIEERVWNGDDWLVA